MSRFLVDRNIFENNIWADPPLFRLFFFILGKAAFKDGIKAGRLELKRGQFLRSYRRLQEDLTYIDNNSQKVYSTKTIKRCIDQLVKDERITISESDHGTLFSIINYEQYQSFSATTPELETASKHPKEPESNNSQAQFFDTGNTTETAWKQQVNNKNEGLTNDMKDKPLSAKKGYQPGFLKFYELYPKKTTKREAGDYWEANSLEKQLDTILEGLDAWKISEQWTKDSGTFIPDPIRFLKKAKWEDRPPVASKQPKSTSGTAVDAHRIVPAHERTGDSGKL